MRCRPRLGVFTVVITNDPRSGDRIMLWHTSHAPQRLSPRGEVVMTWAGQPGSLAGSEKNHDLGRWRS
jgi:hypothetical protein